MASIQTSVTDFFRKKDKKKRKAADEDTEGPRKISSDPPRIGEIDNKKHKSKEPTPEAPPAPAKASPFSSGAKPAAEPTPAPKPALPFSFGDSKAAKPKPAPAPAAAPRPAFSIFGGPKPPPTQDFKAPPYRTLEVWQREGLKGEYKKNTRLYGRKKDLAQKYKCTDNQVDHYWAKLKEADPSYVKDPIAVNAHSKPDVAPGVPALGDVPVETLTALVAEYGVDKSLTAERAKALAQKHNMKVEELENYWRRKLRGRDPNLQKQTYIVDGRSAERQRAKRQDKLESQLSIRRQLDVLDPSMKAFDGVGSLTLTFHVRAGGSLRRRRTKCARC